MHDKAFEMRKNIQNSLLDDLLWLIQEIWMFGQCGHIYYPNKFHLIHLSVFHHGFGQRIADGVITNNLCKLPK